MTQTVLPLMDVLAAKYKPDGLVEQLGVPRYVEMEGFEAQKYVMMGIATIPMDALLIVLF